MVFTFRMGFSGTPSDLLPIELGKCNYELGSDGKMVHVMNNPQVVSCHFVDSGWNPRAVSFIGFYQKRVTRIIYNFGNFKNSLT
jgi:hypothetical protein